MIKIKVLAIALEKFLLNEEKKISLTKLGSWGVALATATLSVLAGPIWLLILCKYIVALSAGTAVCGARDAYRQ